MNTRTIDKKTRHGGFRSLLKRALELGIRITFLPSKILFIRLEYGGNTVFLRGANAPVLRRMGNFTRDKQVTKTVLDTIGIRTPRGIVADSLAQATLLLRKHRLRYPVILKPTHGSRALGVTWDIRSENDLAKAFAHFAKIKTAHSFKQPTFLVEEMFAGDEYRVLVLDGKVISCVHKIPATVIGDGRSTVKKLIAAFNRTRLRGFKIRIDDVVEETLRKNHLTMNSVLPKNRPLRLRHNLNMSDGGRAVDVTGKMCRFFRDLSIRAVHATGLTFGGIDIIASDIATHTKPYVVLEINPNPYYNMNEKPLVEGKGADVSYLLLKQLFPKLRKK